MNPAQQDRRQKPRRKDGFYRFVQSVNFVSWLALIGALIAFHYARPEMITGLQSYWGVQGRETWSQQHVEALIALLQVCLGLALVTMLLRSKRNRRRGDSYGVNLFILASISLVSLFTINISVV